MNKFKSVEKKSDTSTTSSPSSRRSSIDSSSSEITTLYTGEKLSKSDKVFATLGTIEELIAYIGIIKAEHYNTSIDHKFDTPSSTKLFVFAHLTRIQEALNELMKSVGTSRKQAGKFEHSRFQGDSYITELEKQIAQTDLNKAIRPATFIPGTTPLEAKLFYARAIARRAERQLCGSKNVQLGLVVDESGVNFLNRLGDYFLSLALSSLHSQSKEPLKQIAKSSLK